MKQIPTVTTTFGASQTIDKLKALFRPLDFMEERTRKYGDFYQITFKNSPPVVMISNPQAIEEIFTASDNQFDVGKNLKSINFLVGDNSLLLLDGKAHKKRRRLLMPSFHGEALHKYSQKIVDIADKVSDRLEPNRPFKVYTLTQEITLRVILTVVFGIDSGSRYDRLRKLLSDLLNIFNTPLGSSLMFFTWLRKDWGKFSPWGSFLHLKAEIKALIYDEIKERRKLLASGVKLYDVLSLLLLATDENGEGMSDAELHDELITLLIVGHETTASALAWIFYWVHYLPEVKEKLLSELKSLENNFDYQIINHLPYLNALVSETLRIYPIAAGTFERILTKPMSILEYDFQPDTMLMISIYSLHHREDLYPNPKHFNPNRFLEKTYSAYEYIPFGGGNRRCLGSALALLEIKLATAKILSRFQFELTSQNSMLPVIRGFTYAPPASFKMVAQSFSGR